MCRLRFSFSDCRFQDWAFASYVVLKFEGVFLRVQVRVK